MPRVSVVLPVPLSPPTASMTGRIVTMLLLLSRFTCDMNLLEYTAGENVFRFDRLQLSDTHLAAAGEESIRLPKPRAVERVANAAGVGEVRLSHASFNVCAQRRFS